MPSPTPTDAHDLVGRFTTALADLSLSGDPQTAARLTDDFIDIFKAFPKGLMPGDPLKHVVQALFDMEKLDDTVDLAPLADAIGHMVDTQPGWRDSLATEFDRERALTKSNGTPQGLRMGWLHHALARGWIDDARVQRLAQSACTSEGRERPVPFALALGLSHSDDSRPFHVQRSLEALRRAQSLGADVEGQGAWVGPDGVQRTGTLLHAAIENVRPDLAEQYLRHAQQPNAPVALTAPNQGVAKIVPAVQWATNMNQPWMAEAIEAAVKTRLAVGVINAASPPKLVRVA